MRSSKRLTPKILFLAIGFALICRLTVAFLANADQSRFVDPDSMDYIELADHLADGAGYTKGDEPEIFRAPGYPWILSFFRSAFPGNLLPVVLFQAFLSVGSIYLLWRLALLVSGGDVCIANTAVVFQALTLTSVVFSNKILSETLFTFLMLSALLIMETALAAPSEKDKNNPKTTVRSAAVAAIFAGCAAAAALMTRAILLPVIPLFALYLGIGVARRRGTDESGTTEANDFGAVDASGDDRPTPAASPRRTRLGFLAAILFLLPVSLAYAGWSIRNSRAANFAGFSSVGRINIYRYYACLLLAKNNGRSFADQQGICTAELESQGSQARQAAYALRKGLPIILREPLRYALLHLKTDVSSLLPDTGDLYRLLGFDIGGNGTLSVIRSKGILAGIKHYFDGRWALFFLALPLTLPLFAKFAAAVVGTLAFPRSGRGLTLLFFAVLTTYMLIVPGAVSHPRFRVPVEPLLSLLAAYGVVWITRSFRLPHMPCRRA